MECTASWGRRRASDSQRAHVVGMGLEGVDLAAGTGEVREASGVQPPVRPDVDRGTPRSTRASITASDSSPQCRFSAHVRRAVDAGAAGRSRRWTRWATALNGSASHREERPDEVSHGQRHTRG
jgi:hypothetical protein